MDENAIKKLLKEFADAVTKDLASYKAAIARLTENQEAEHKKMLELAEEVNKHTNLLNELNAAVAKALAEREGPRVEHRSGGGGVN